MALTTSGSVEPPRNPRADNDAARPYSTGSATRMDRMSGISDVAASHTSTPTAESSYADGAFALGEATQTPEKAAK